MLVEKISSFVSHHEPGKPLSVDNDTAVGVDGLTGDTAAVGTCQKDEASGNLRRLTWPAHGRSELFLSLVVHGRWDQRRPDRAGGNSVDTDALGHKLVGQASGEGDDSTLCRGVVEKIWSADVCINGGVVDDGVSLLHVLESIFGQVEERVNVSLESELPLISALMLVTAGDSDAMMLTP